ncbi:MAG: hypothetical protein IJ446_08935 [Oscillospiraceae bacterium]|nr:hypothetical protein [Oscillospiraceae bacterium]
MSIIKTEGERVAQRTDIEVYMEINTVSYAQCGAAWLVFSESPNAQTKSRKFINEKTERSNITRYAPQWSFECLLMYDRPEIKKLYDIVKQRKTGSDTVVTFIVVDKFDKDSARMVRAAVQITSLDDDDDMIIKGTFYNQGDEVLGTFDTNTGVFTPSASAAGGTDDENTSTSGDETDPETN